MLFYDTLTLKSLVCFIYKCLEGGAFMKNMTFKLGAIWTGLLALVVAVNMAQDAVDMLLARSEGYSVVRIANAFACARGGGSFAMVRNGAPTDAADYDTVEVMGFTVYVPRTMSFEDDMPNIITFQRRTGSRDVGVSNVTR